MTRPRILLVEDETNFRRVLTDFLKSGNYVVESSADGLEGQELAAREGFDLIILDVMLPSRDGFNICRHLITSTTRRRFRAEAFDAWRTAAGIAA